MQLDSDAQLVGHSMGHADCAFGPLQAAELDFIDRQLLFELKRKPCVANPWI
jgi:hypothetical protein